MLFQKTNFGNSCFLSNHPDVEDLRVAYQTESKTDEVVWLWIALKSIGFHYVTLKIMRLKTNSFWISWSQSKAEFGSGHKVLQQRSPSMVRCSILQLFFQDHLGLHSISDIGKSDIQNHPCLTDGNIHLVILSPDNITNPMKFLWWLWG